MSLWQKKGIGSMSYINLILSKLRNFNIIYVKSNKMRDFYKNDVVFL